MKSLLAVLVLFLVMLGAILWNGRYFDQITKEYEAMLESADFEKEKECLEIVLDLSEQWKKTGNIMQITVNHTRVDNITALLDTLKTSLQTQNQSEYEKSAALLHNAFAELRLMEKFTFINIF